MNTYTHPSSVASVEQIIVPDWAPEPSFLPCRFTGRSIPMEPGLYLDESQVEVLNPEYLELDEVEIQRAAIA